MDLQQQAVQTQEQFASPEMRPETTTPATTALACNFGSLLSFSCRTRAESFARKLQLKLTTLGNNGTEDPMQALLLDSSSVAQPYTWNVPSEKSPLKVTVENDTASQSFVYHNNNNELPGQVGQMNSESSSQQHLSSDSNCASAMVKDNSVSDSDFYFDFDIGSPGSPTESCYSVINPCDDLYCKDCSCPAQNCHHCSKKQVNGTASDHGFESGCVFSSPASTSPDAYQNDTEFGTPLDSLSVFAFPSSDESPKEELKNGIDVGDCSSDASDSTYYDVESSFSSSSSCSSPKVSEDFLQEHRPEECSTVPPQVNEIKHYEQCKPYETVDELLSGLRIISLSNVKNSSQSTTTSSATTGDEESKEQNHNSEKTEKKEESERPKSPLRLNVHAASLSAFHDKPLLSPNSDDDDERPRIQRSSSLKTGKTPPGTPGRKKIVRFADVLGLDLADVRTFLDEIPNVPKSAFRDLDGALEQFNSTTNNATLTQRPSSGFNKTVVPSFHQPVSMPDYFDRIRDQKVLLENAFLGDHFTIKGTVRVMNMDFHKSVYIRYTYDEWRTFTEIQAIYVNGSCDGFSDKFEFSLALSPQNIEIGGRLTFACRFHCQGQQFWDNNAGRNYVFHCVPASTQTQQNLYDLHGMTPSMEDPWINHMWM